MISAIYVDGGISLSRGCFSQSQCPRKIEDGTARECVAPILSVEQAVGRCAPAPIHKPHIAGGTGNRSQSSAVGITGGIGGRLLCPGRASVYAFPESASRHIYIEGARCDWIGNKQVLR